MLKSIPKSSISKRAFPVYKQWEFTHDDYPLISASASVDDANHSLYRSIKAKFYNTGSADIFNTFGRYNNLVNIGSERELSSQIYILKLPQSTYGEEIKPGSVSFSSSGVDYIDDDGRIVSTIPQYTITLLDLETQDIQITGNDGEVFDGTIISFDVESGFMTATFNGDTDSFEVGVLDFESGVLRTPQELNFDGLSIDQLVFGNVFYDEGLFVFKSETIEQTDYNINYRSTKTIYETEVLVSARAGEFNYSQNPSAVTVTLSGSYDFTTTAITNGEPAGTKRIKEVLDISQRQSYTGSIGSSVGTWDDYFEYSSTDLTGSYLAPYITTIGLYDDSGDMVAVAKLPTPIKNLPDYDMNFIVRFDT